MNARGRRAERLRLLGASRRAWRHAAQRDRALLEHVVEVVDVAVDADWREAVDIMVDLSDLLRAELRA